MILNSCAPAQDKTENFVEIYPESEQSREFGDEETLEYIFLKMNLFITERISYLKEKPAHQRAASDIISIVNTAERLYLQGNTIKAIELLDRAEELLEQSN